MYYKTFHSCHGNGLLRAQTKSSQYWGVYESWWVHWGWMQEVIRCLYSKLSQSQLVLLLGSVLGRSRNPPGWFRWDVLLWGTPPWRPQSSWNLHGTSSSSGKSHFWVVVWTNCKSPPCRLGPSNRTCSETSRNLAASESAEFWPGPARLLGLQRGPLKLEYCCFTASKLLNFLKRRFCDRVDGFQHVGLKRCWTRSWRRNRTTGIPARTVGRESVSLTRAGRAIRPQTFHFYICGKIQQWRKCPATDGRYCTSKQVTPPITHRHHDNQAQKRPKTPNGFFCLQSQRA